MYLAQINLSICIDGASFIPYNGISNYINQGGYVMLKRRLLCLLLAALLTLGLLPAAQAQEAGFVPGETTTRLLKDAFLSGRMLLADANLSLGLNAETFGLTTEEAEAMEILFDILKDSVVTVGAARIPEGIALLLRATYGENPVSADVTLSLTTTGAAIETSLLPGEQVFISWEAALTAAGLDEASIASILALPSTDPEQMMALISQSVQLGTTMISMTAAPYLQIFSNFAAALPSETQYDVAAEGQFPAAKRETVMLITQKALGDLLTSLSNQLENDVTLKPMLDSMLASAGDPSLNTAAMCAAMREFASVLTDEEYPFYFFVGYDETDEPLYGSLSFNDLGGTAYALNLIDISERIGSDAAGCLLQAYMATEALYNGLSLSFYNSEDPVNPNVRTIGAAAELQISNQPLFAAEYALNTQPAITASGLSAYNTTQEFTLNVQYEGSDISASFNGQTRQEETADGGEITASASLIEGYANGTLMTQQNSQHTFSISPTADGFNGAFTGEYAAPQEGIENSVITCSIYDLPYAPAADAAVLSLDTASEEDLSALLGRLQTSAQPVIESLIDQLPEPLRQEIAGS